MPRKKRRRKFDLEKRDWETERERAQKVVRQLLSRPSRLWWLVPVLFALVGGLIGYVVVKDRDARMSRDLLLIGIVVAFFEFLLLYF